MDGAAERWNGLLDLGQKTGGLKFGRCGSMGRTGGEGVEGWSFGHGLGTAGCFGSWLEPGDS